MELDPALQIKWKTLRLHPLIQRRELMFGMALAANAQMSDEERSHDQAHAGILAMARTQFCEALIEKGMQPDSAAQVVQHVESQNNQASRLMMDLVGSLATIRRTSDQRAALPLHMQGHQHFGTQERVGDKMAHMLDGQEENYVAMLRCLLPRDYKHDRFVIGSYVRSDVEFDLHGSNVQDKAESLKQMLNALKTELGIEGLHISARPGQPSRGIVTSYKVTAEASVIKALAEAYGREPERFKEVAAQASKPSREID